MPSYRLDIGSRIWAIDWYQDRWPWMTLNRRNVPYFALFYRNW